MDHTAIKFTFTNHFHWTRDHGGHYTATSGYFKHLALRYYNCHRELESFENLSSFM